MSSETSLLLQTLKDTIARSEDLPWIERTPKSSSKYLWVGPESGTWAGLNRWSAGFALPPHKHLTGAHLFVLSGKLRVRGNILNPGDYCFEAPGVVHEATTAVDDTIFLSIGGPYVFLDENGATTGYVNWETIAKLREEHYGKLQS